jgi:hypothetical protein
MPFDVFVSYRQLFIIFMIDLRFSRELEKCHNKGIIEFTHLLNISYNRSFCNESERRRKETTGFTEAQLLESTMGECERIVIFNKRFFQCRRSGTGEIRIAASGARRKYECIRSLQVLWVISSSLLSNFTGFQSRWHGRVISPGKRPPALSQVNRQSDGVYRSTNKKSAKANESNACSGFGKRTGSQDTFKKHRTGVSSTEKKSTLLNSSTSLDEIQNNYEILRDISINDSYNSGGRSWGLQLFLNQGSGAWFKAISTIHPKAPALLCVSKETEQLAIPKSACLPLVMTLSQIILKHFRGVRA